MGFWCFLFVCNLLIPATMIIFGYMMWKHCQSDINYISGYRTKRSMKNSDTWKFANNYAGRLWWKLGWVLIIPTALVQLPFMKCGANKVGILSLVITSVQLVIMLFTIILVEKAIKKNFNDDEISH